MTLLLTLAVGIVGGLAAIARFWLDRLVSARLRGAFPAGTLAVNALGSLGLGVLSGAGVAGDAYLLAGTTLIGTFTTFSTWMLETHRLAEDGQGRPAAANLAVSLAAGLALVALGRAVGGAL